tara:strand:+ start:2525 stop:2938 length:414 start_codon:yes stop_codon:yes gene_type:complete
MEKNCWTGFVQEEFLDEYTFHAQYHEFHNKGQTRDPSLGNLKGTPGILQSSTILEQKGEGSQKQPEKKRKRKRSELDDPSKDTYEGPWKTPESIANMKLAVAVITLLLTATPIIAIFELYKLVWFIHNVLLVAGDLV